MEVEKKREKESVLDVSWPDHLKRKRGDGSIMELKIRAVDKAGKAFLVDRTTGREYYHDSKEGIREAQNMDYHPANTPGMVEAVTGRQIWWLNEDIFRPITFDSLEGAAHYLNHLAELYRNECIERLNNLHSSAKFRRTYFP